jgi:hypothetical protein
MFEKYKDYPYSQIAAAEPKYPEEGQLKEFGSNSVGESFLVLSLASGKLYSFILTGALAGEYIYTCVYAE